MQGGGGGRGRGAIDEAAMPPAERTARAMQVVALSDARAMLTWIREEVHGCASDASASFAWGEVSHEQGNGEVGWNEAVRVEAIVLLGGGDTVAISAASEGYPTSGVQSTSGGPPAAMSIANAVLALLIFLASLVVGAKLVRTARKGRAEGRAMVAAEEEERATAEKLHRREVLERAGRRRRATPVGGGAEQQQHPPAPNLPAATSLERRRRGGLGGGGVGGHCRAELRRSIGPPSH